MRERGFSLVETLVATAILVVALGALAQLFAYSARANRIARATTLKTLLARQKMEELRLEANPPTGGSLEEDVSGFHDAGSHDYARRWAIEPVGAGPSLVIRVSVTSALPGDVRLVSIRTTGGPW